MCSFFTADINTLHEHTIDIPDIKHSTLILVHSLYQKYSSFSEGVHTHCTISEGVHTHCTISEGVHTHYTISDEVDAIANID